MKSSLTLCWVALGVLEFVNAAKCLRSPKAALAEADLVGADVLARGSAGGAAGLTIRLCK